MEIEIRVSPFDISRISIIASGRRLRPKQYMVKKTERREVICPFCPGHEYDTPPAVLVLTRDLKFSRDKDSRRVRDWLVRIFPNKYPALSREASGELDKPSTYGYHEVLVESPIHEEDEYLRNIDHIYCMLYTLKRRIHEIYLDKRVRHITIIKNYGPGAGASIRHPHLQIFANTFTPPNIIFEIEGFRRYKEAYGMCPLCKLAGEHNERVIINGKYFKAEARYAPKQSYEILIYPKNHEASILETDDKAFKELASIISKVIRGLRTILGDIDYNYWFHIAPKEYDGPFHWHIEVQPLMETWGGYEKGSGVHIVTVSPEEAARNLRNAIKTL